MSEPEFLFQVFEEDGVIVGAKGTGKTTRAKWIKSKIPEIPTWIYDYQWLFNGFGTTTHNIEDLQRGNFVFQPMDKSYATFEKFCYRIFDEKGNVRFPDMVIIWDEIHQYISKQKSCPPLYSIVLSGRNQGISNIFIATRPASIPNWILTNSTHCFAYRLHNKGDIEWLKDYIGDKAYLLLPADKRDKFQDLERIGLHSCVYRNQNQEESFIFD